MGTSGAPCPAAATSRTRKSLTTSMPVRSAITAGSPNCHVECRARARRSGRGSRSPLRPRDQRPLRRSRRSRRPRASRRGRTPSRQYSRGVAPIERACKSIALRRRRRRGRSCLTSRTTIRPSSPRSNRTTAAEMPSSDVPDMSPTTIRASAGRVTVMSGPAAGRRRRRDGSRRRLRRALSPPPSRSTPSFCMTIAVFTRLSAASSSARASSRDTPQTSMTMRSLRSASFAFVALRSTIRLPYVLPMRIIAPVVIMLSTIFVAVPALRRVEPVTTSGPTIAMTATSTLREQLLRHRRARDDRRARAAFTRALERAVDERRRARCGDADDDVALAHVMLVDHRGAAGGRILGAFLRAQDRGEPAGDDALHHLGVAAERRRAFARVEHAEAAGRAGADVEEPAVTAECIFGERDELRDLARAASRPHRRPCGLRRS